MSNEVPAIGTIIRTTRLARGMTLDQLAATSGVSKSMLSQIERELANPTFAVLWGITRALDVDIGALTSGADTGVLASRIEVIPHEGVPEMRTRDGLCALRILSPPHYAGTTEWYDLTFEPGGQLDSPPHQRGAFEHVTVFDGVLEVTSGGDVRRVEAGEIARYPADVPHRIAQIGTTPARALLVVIHA